MKIAFIHYHVKTGGVTTVLKQQVNAIKDSCDILMLAGELPQSPFPAEIVHIPGLGYDSSSPGKGSPESVAEAVVEAIHRRWPDGCDLLHVHNPTLAKNRRFLQILKTLQQRGLNLFLQIHDFAEDGRPDAYFRDEYVGNCHYGVINSRDYGILIKAGLNPEGLHLIANTVDPLDVAGSETDRENIVLYPVRAIRRKNIGEAILLSLFFNRGETLCITQPPNSAADIASYHGWKGFIRDHHLDVMLETGVKERFADLVNRSRYMLTTSITEGFGFTYLEPWTAGKYLWGRKLPDICRDFEKMGIHLDHMYDKLQVPLKWIDEEKFHQRWRSCVLTCCTRYCRSMAPDHLEEGFGHLTKNGRIDFGMLDEEFQMQVITRVMGDRRGKARLSDINPCLAAPSELSDQAHRITQNRIKIGKEFTPERYRRNLMGIYRVVSQVPIRHRIDKEKLFREFFNLESFSLLKWGRHANKK